MSADATWVVPQPRPAGLRCRYCARVLDEPTTPDRMSPHCTARGCRVCLECATGKTPVSPLAKAATA